MEESLVLYGGKARVIEIVAELEGAGFVNHPGHLFDASHHVRIFRVQILDLILRLVLGESIIFVFLFVANRILSCLLVELPFHQDVKEHCDSGEVRQLTADINGPEEGVGLGILTVGETYQVDGHVAHHSSLVEGCPDSLTDLRQIDLW